MSRTEPLPMDEDELERALAIRAGRASLSPPEADRLATAIMGQVAAAPLPARRQPHAARWSVAASVGGLAVVAVAVIALVSGLPANVAGGPSPSPSLRADPAAFDPTHVLTADELNVLLDRHAVGDVVAHLTTAPGRLDQSVPICTPSATCQPIVGWLDRGMGDVRSSVVADPTVAAAVATEAIDGVAALHLDGTDQVELLGLLDQGVVVVAPLPASAPGIPPSSQDHPERAVVVEGWLVGPASDPRWIIPTSYLVSDVSGAALPADAIALSPEAFSTWTVHQERFASGPDEGLFVLRPLAEGGATPTDPRWTIVGRLNGVRLPVPLTTVTVGAWTATCHDVPDADCDGAAAVFIDHLGWSGQDVFDGSGGLVHVTARSGCPPGADAARWQVCFQVSASVPADAACMVIARDPDGGYAQVGGPIPGRAGPLPSGWPRCV